MFFANTDVGMRRSANQDYYLVQEDIKDFKLYILADGMGGYKGGEIASKLACESVKEYIIQNVNKINKKREELLKIVKESMEYANKVVHEKAKKDIEFKEMGTTLEVCLIYNNKAYIGHVGDSRIYRIRKNTLRRLTKDHSYVQQLLDEKKITRQEALSHPEKNMLMKAIGCFDNIDPDVRARYMEKEDILIMCSDGLTNMVSETKIQDIVEHNKQIAVDRLIEEANKSGGRDNITVIIIV